MSGNPVLKIQINLMCELKLLYMYVDIKLLLAIILFVELYNVMMQ